MDKQQHMDGRRLARVAVFAMVRGAGMAIGGALVTAILWWCQAR
ncbi:hypothetical protein [Streptomyces sp. NPDC001750]